MIRRVALGLTSVLLFLNLGALAWVKTSASPQSKLHVQVIVDHPELASKVKAKLESSGFTVTLVPGEKMERMVVDGYRVTLSSNDPNELKPILKTLQHDKFPAKMVGSDIQVGGTFKTRKLAEAQQAKVAAYGLHVTEKTKKGRVKVTRVEFDVDSMDKLDALKPDMKELGVPAEDVQVVPVGPGVGASSTSSATPSEKK